MPAPAKRAATAPAPRWKWPTWSWPSIRCAARKMMKTRTTMSDTSNNDAGKAAGGKPAARTEAKAPPKSARRRSRELALQGLYQWLLNRNDIGAIQAHLHDAQGFNKADREHFDALLNGSVREEERLTAAFQPYLDRP